MKHTSFVWAAGAAAAASLWSGAARAEQWAPDPQDTSFWSNLMLAAPVYTRHVPHDHDFNDHNWGLFAVYDLGPHWSLVGGDFNNSYRKNTAFVALGYTPIHLQVSNVQLGLGGIVGVDLTGGYRHYNQLDPLLGALTLRLSGKAPPDSPWRAFNRFGLLTTVIPADPRGGSTAINLALTFRLQ